MHCNNCDHWKCRRIAYIDTYKRKMKLKPLHSNNSNIHIEMFNATIVSYFVTIVIVACAYIEIATDHKYSMEKKDKNIKDSNGNQIFA